VPALGVPPTEIVRVEVAVPPEGTDTVPGLNVSVNPEIVLADRETVPEKPFWLVIVIVEVPGVCWVAVIDVGFAETLKSGGGNTVKVRLVEWVSVPIMPVTVTG
jgi:hypothetical protein